MSQRRSKRNAVRYAISKQSDFPKKPDWVDLTFDEWQAHCFLSGYDEPIANYDPPPGEPSYPILRTFFLRGQNEVMGRQALIRVLKGEKPLPTALRGDLINLFENGTVWGPRKLVFKHRKTNSHRTTTAVAIGAFVSQQMRLNPKRKKEAIIREAMATFRKSRKTIFKALALRERALPILEQAAREFYQSS